MREPRATDQAVLTVVTAIEPADLSALRAVLAGIAAELPPNPPPGGGALLRCDRLATVHFLRWVILEDGRDAAGAAIPAQLVMSTAYDGPLDRHLAELAAVAGAALDAIYSHCAGYGPAGRRTADGIAAYLRAHQVAPAACFLGTRWRTVADIRGESALREALEGVLDGLAPGRAAAATPAESLRAYARDTPAWRWALAPPAAPSLAWWVVYYGRLLAIVVALIAALPLLLPVGLVALFLLRRDERREAASAPPAEAPGAAQLDRLTQLEDFDVQNQMTLVSNVKPGQLRRLLLGVALLYARFRTAYLDTHGALVGIPSIHFAHWTLIDGGRRLLFLSNYDGTWESYLGEFIDRAGHGVNAIWSNTLGFPPARFLILDGAGDEQRFKAWVRAQQVPTEVWYAAYPRLSVRNVNNNTALRAGLSAPLSPAALGAWLQRF